MATGDVVNVKGTYATVQAAASTADGAISAGSTTSILAALGATEEDYPLLDLKLTVSVGTPTLGGTINVYRQPSDGTNASPTTKTNYLQQYVGSFIIDDAAVTQYYYLYAVPNFDNNDTFVLENDSGSTLTIALAARGRSYNTAA